LFEGVVSREAAIGIGVILFIQIALFMNPTPADASMGLAISPASGNYSVPLEGAEITYTVFNTGTEDVGVKVVLGGTAAPFASIDVAQPMVASQGYELFKVRIVPDISAKEGDRLRLTASATTVGGSFSIRAQSSLDLRLIGSKSKASGEVKADPLQVPLLALCLLSILLFSLVGRIGGSGRMVLFLAIVPLLLSFTFAPAASAYDIAISANPSAGCGDGSCNSTYGEDCSSCIADCGVCTTTTTVAATTPTTAWPNTGVGPIVRRSTVATSTSSLSTTSAPTSSMPTTTTVTKTNGNGNANGNRNQPPESAAKEPAAAVPLGTWAFVLVPIALVAAYLFFKLRKKRALRKAKKHHDKGGLMPQENEPIFGQLNPFSGPESQAAIKTVAVIISMFAVFSLTTNAAHAYEIEIFVQTPNASECVNSGEFLASFPCSNAFDGDYDTYSLFDYSNYTNGQPEWHWSWPRLPRWIYGAKLEVKTGAGYENFSIPDNCLTEMYYDGFLNISVVQSDQLRLLCYDGGDGLDLGTVASDKIFEAGMFWDAEMPGATYTDAIWHLDEGSGASTIDVLSGLTLISGVEPAWVPGINGSAAYFDGTNSLFAFYKLCPGETGTLNAWVKPAGPSPDADGGGGTIIARGFANGITNYWMVYDHLGDGGVNCYLDDVLIGESYPIPTDQWSMVTCKWNQTGSYLYVNGSVQSQGAPVQMSCAEDGIVSIGDLYEGMWDRHFLGSIDEVGVNSSDRTDAEILWTFDSMFAPPENNAPVVDSLEVDDDIAPGTEFYVYGEVADDDGLFDIASVNVTCHAEGVEEWSDSWDSFTLMNSSYLSWEEIDETTYSIVATINSSVGHWSSKSMSGFWDCALYVTDSSGASDGETFQEISVQTSTGITVGGPSCSFAGGIPGGAPVRWNCSAAESNNTVTNSGNTPFNVSLSGADLVGESDTGWAIGAGNVTWQLALSCDGGTLGNASFANATNALPASQTVLVQDWPRGSFPIPSTLNITMWIAYPSPIKFQSYNGTLTILADNPR
jgi:hypothetical protein